MLYITSDLEKKIINTRQTCLCNLYTIQCNIITAIDGQHNTIRINISTIYYNKNRTYYLPKKQIILICITVLVIINII